MPNSETIEQLPYVKVGPWTELEIEAALPLQFTPRRPGEIGRLTVYVTEEDVRYLERQLHARLEERD
jgi:hypothetical protein